MTKKKYLLTLLVLLLEMQASVQTTTLAFSDCRISMVADQQITFDLDEGVVKDYAKFGDFPGKIK